MYKTLIIGVLGGDMLSARVVTRCIMLLVIGWPPLFSMAADCGSIIQPEVWFDANTPLVTTPVANCGNPFGVNTDPLGPLYLNQVSVVMGDIIALELSQPVTLDVTALDSGGALVQYKLYRHDGPDYVLVPIEYKNEPYKYNTSLIQATYTLVIEDIPIFGGFGDFGIPSISPTIAALTFSITELSPPSVPTDASSVLFLPGIQASRLYAGENIPIPGFFNDIRQDERVWEPGNNNDVEALRMTPNGESEHVIYVGDILTSASVDIGLGIAVSAGDFYAGISRMFDELVIDGQIAAWLPYAYDWRYDVATAISDGVMTDAVGTRRDIIAELVQLATGSFSGRVTIVAHSNGGLLAKALLRELSTHNLEHLVDTIVFVGVPQLGTPKAIGTILHGYDQELGQGWVVDASRARRIINNLPGAYGLLPTAEYLAQAPFPVVSFDTLPATRDYRERFGDAITTLPSLNEFVLSGASPASTTLPRYEIVQANNTLLTKAQALHVSQLADWEAPTGVRVVELVGIGLPTPVGIQYTDTGQFDCEGGFWSGITECVRAKPRPVALLSVFGDQTVMAQSAAAYTQVKETYYVDLNLLSSVNNFEFNHANMTEAPALQELITQLIATATAPMLPTHVFATKPINTEQVYTVEVVASPVALSTTDAVGRTTGAVPTASGWEVRQEIPGSQYFTLGGVQHVIVPETDEQRTTTLTGLTEGTFSYLVYRVATETQTLEHAILNATATSALRGQIEIIGANFGDMAYDYDGDGQVDATETLAREYYVITAATDLETTSLVSRERTSTGTRTVRPIVLGVTTSQLVSEATSKQWQQLYQTLVQLSVLLAQWQLTMR